VSGSTLYVGGFFTSIGGQVRTGIAALDAATGTVTDWNPSANNSLRFSNSGRASAPGVTAPHSSPP